MSPWLPPSKGLNHTLKMSPWIWEAHSYSQRQLDPKVFFTSGGSVNFFWKLQKQLANKKWESSTRATAPREQTCVSGTSQLQCDKWWSQTKPAPSSVGAVGSINHQCCNFPGGSNNSVGHGKMKSLHLAGCNRWHHTRVEEMPSGKTTTAKEGCTWRLDHLLFWDAAPPRAWHRGRHCPSLPTYTTSLIVPNSRTSHGERFPPAVHWPELGHLPAGRINPILFARWQEMCAGNRRPPPSSFTPDSSSPGVPLISHYFLSSTAVYYHLNSLSAWDVLWGFCLCCLWN